MFNEDAYSEAAVKSIIQAGPKLKESTQNDENPFPEIEPLTRLPEEPRYKVFVSEEDLNGHLFTTVLFHAFVCDGHMTHDYDIAAGWLRDKKVVRAKISIGSSTHLTAPIVKLYQPFLALSYLRISVSSHERYKLIPANKMLRYIPIDARFFDSEDREVEVSSMDDLQQKIQEQEIHCKYFDGLIHYTTGRITQVRLDKKGFETEKGVTYCYDTV